MTGRFNVFRTHCIIIATALCLFSAATGAASSARDHEIVPEDYFSLQYAGDLALSPDGDHVAWVQSGWEAVPGGGRKSQLWAMDVKSTAVQRLTFDITRPHSPAWSPDGAWIYFGGRLDLDGGDAPRDGSHQVWRIRPDGTGLFAVTRVEDGIGDFELSNDGSVLYYTVGSETTDDPWRDMKSKWSKLEYGHGVGEFTEVHALDLIRWRDDVIVEPTRVIHDLAFSPDGRRLAMQTTPDEEVIFNEGWSRIDVLDLETGETEIVAGPQWRTDHPSPYGWLTEMAWAPDSRALAFAISYDGYASQMWVAEWTDGPARLFRIPRPGVVTLAGHLDWRGKGRTLTYLGDERGRTRLYQVEKVENGSTGETGSVTPGDVVLTDYVWDRKGRNVLAAADLLDDTGNIFNVEKGTLRRLTDINPQMATWILPQIEVFEWIGADGDPVEGILELPAGYDRATGGPLPTMIELHGGPTACTHISFRLWIYGRALLPAKGYALLSPNYHGSEGYGDVFLSKLIGRENEIEVTDIATGVEALIEAGIADRDKLGVMGWSNGGYLTNCMITKHPDMFKAASSGAGVLDMAIQWSLEDTPGHVINFVEGLPWEQPAHYQDASPLYLLDRIKTPTLIHQGGADPRVPPAHSRALYRALYHYLDVPVELVVYPGEPHGLTTYDNRLAKMQWDLAWFDRYLMGNENGDGQ